MRKKPQVKRKIAEKAKPGKAKAAQVASYHARRAAPEVKNVVLEPTAVLKVELPKGHVPVVAVDPVRRIVEIVPVPKKKKKSFWETLFGL